MLSGQVPDLARLRIHHITGNSLASLVGVEMREGAAAVSIHGHGLVVEVITYPAMFVSRVGTTRRRHDVLKGPPDMGRPMMLRSNMTPFPPGPDMATTFPLTELPLPPSNMAE